MNDFLKPINIPSLQDPHFQQNFNDFCVAIKQNFEKLISVQYTRGEKGTSIITKQLSLIENRRGEWCLNKFGATLMNTIFHTEAFVKFMTKATFEEVLEEVANNIVGYYAITWDKIANTTVDVFIDPSAGKTYMSNPYIFMDGRINGLPNYLKEEENQTVTITSDTEDSSLEMSEENAVDGDKYRTFNDFTCSVMGKATFRDEEENIIDEGYANQDDPATWDWTLDALEIVPKLYFDENNHEFCWKVNGQETQVTAQGLRGTNGTSTSVHIVKGRLESNNNYIRIDQVEYISRALDGNPRRVWHNVDPESSKDDEYNAFEAIKDKDLVLAYYTIPGDNFQYAFMGQAIVVSDTVKKLYIGADQTTDDPRLDIFYSIMNQTIRQRMNLIHYSAENDDNPTGNTQNTVRGLFLKCRDIYHMLYSVWEVKDGVETATHDIRITPTDAASTNSEVREATVVDDDATFHIDYNVEMKNGKVHGDLDVDGNEAVKGDVQVQGGASVQGAFQAMSDALIQGNTQVQGVTTLQDVIIKGSLVQEGDVRSDLKIKGTTITSGINKQNDNEYSKFATACISEIQDVKTYVHGTRIPTQFAAAEGNTTPQELLDLQQKYYGSQDIPLKGVNRDVKIGGDIYKRLNGETTNTAIGRRYEIKQNSPETFKVYLGISFNLHLIIGYMGYGNEYAKNATYIRRKTGNVKRENSHQNLNDILEYANLYNVCEYDIPCYAYREIYLGGSDDNEKNGFTFDEGGTGSMNSTVKGWRQCIIEEKDGAKNKVDSTFFVFSAVANPINYGGRLLYPVVKFNAKVSIDEGCSYGWQKKGNVPLGHSDSSSEGGGTYQHIANTFLDVIFYQGSVEVDQNNAFGLMVNENIDGSLLAQTNVTCIYGTEDVVTTNEDGTETTQKSPSNKVNMFAPLWPYQICESAPITEQAGASGLPYKISNECNIYPEGETPDTKENDTDPDPGWRTSYKNYIMEVALPRMCAISRDMVQIKATRTYVLDGNKQVTSDKVNYESSVDHYNTIPQRYISFFNSGRVKSDGTPIFINPSFDIVNIFRIGDTDIMSGNANVCYERYNHDNGIADDIQAIIDEDIDSYDFTEEVIKEPQQIEVPTLFLKRNKRLLRSVVGSLTGNLIASTVQPVKLFALAKSDPDYVRGDNTIHVLGHSVLEYQNGNNARISGWYNSNRTIRISGTGSETVIVNPDPVYIAPVPGGNNWNPDDVVVRYAAPKSAAPRQRGSDYEKPIFK